MSQKKWDQVYHFTSLKSLEQIARNGYIALNDVTKSNDPAEGIYVLDMMREAYRKLWRDREMTEEQYIRIHQMFFDFCENEKSGGRQNQMVLSLSLCEPDNSLALWRLYGDRGRGAAIGMAKSTLERIGEKSGFRFRKVEYYDEEELLRRHKAFWKAHLQDGEEALMTAIREQYISGYFVKREENSYEKEWRLIYTGVNLEPCKIPRLEPEVPEELDAYAKEGDLVFYYKLPVNGERLIEHISLGPQCKAKACEMIVFLKRHRVPHLGITYASEIMR